MVSFDLPNPHGSSGPINIAQVISVSPRRSLCSVLRAARAAIGMGEPTGATRPGPKTPKSPAAEASGKAASSPLAKRTLQGRQASKDSGSSRIASTRMQLSLTQINSSREIEFPLCSDVKLLFLYMYIVKID